MRSFHMTDSPVHRKQRGAVSLFIVIFSALLITVLTISFIRLMVRDQQQASDSDLSRSAYDSAVSGVEDAKRAILKYQNLCVAGNPSLPACTDIIKAFNSGSCNTLETIGLVGVTSQTVDGNQEVPIQSTNGAGQSLNQAYTCVTIALDTPDYLGTLRAGESNIIPLTADDGTQIQSIELSWFTYADFSSSNPSATQIVDVPSITDPTKAPLYAAGGSTLAGSTWPKNRPSVVRTQLIQYSKSAGFTLSNLDNTSNGQSDANTLFLYPSQIGLSAVSFSDDARRNNANSPELIKCNQSLLNAMYACTATITLPDPIGGSAADRAAYLRLSPLYNMTDYSVKLKDTAGNYTPFHGVQPSVDSTGRANDLFRRVQSRIELTSNFAYPQATVDVTGNLCKNFLVTNSVGDYKNLCTP